MCFTDKRKKNLIRKEDRVSDRVRPPGGVGYGAGRHNITTQTLIRVEITEKNYHKNL